MLSADQSVNKSGNRHLTVASILEKIVVHKRIEIAALYQTTSREEAVERAENGPPIRDFMAAIRCSPEVSLIAEVKQASPSKGLIREDFDPLAIASAYQDSGASCISVLTDQHFFQGHLDFLRWIRESTQIPLLRKDFILDPLQIYEARAAGADAVLLIAECLPGNALRNLHDLTVSLGMTPLVELYDPSNIQRVIDCGARLVGVNNRDLNTFEVDLGHTIRVKQCLPSDRIIVGESGIFTRSDVKQLGQAGVDAMLVGESLMRAPDIGHAVRNLLSDL